MHIRTLALILAFAFVRPPAWGMTLEEVACQDGLLRKGYRQDIRESFVPKFAEKVYASDQENQKWIDVALSAARRIHVVAENSRLKELNDKIFKNKDLVTALTNFQKELFIEELRKRLPGLAYEFYSDFKSIRLAIAEPVSAEDYATLETVFTEANRRFYASPVLTQITRGMDMSRPWFHMGVGQSADQAALAARYARIDGGAKQIRYYWEPAVKKNLLEKLEIVRALHLELLEELHGTGLAGTTGLALDVFAEARKATLAEGLGANLSQMSLGAPVSLATAEKILKYLQATDEFSPNMLVAKRETLTIHDAPYGAISLDFIGLGAENLKSTVKALIESSDLEDAVRRTRAEERLVTKLFEQRKTLVRAAVDHFFDGQVTSRFSGDDGVIIPQREFLWSDQLFLIQKLSSLMPRPFFRMAVVNKEAAASANSSQIITHAESVEKKLRTLMLKQFGASLLNEMNFSVAIFDSGAHRKVYLAYGASRVFTEDEKKIFKKMFPQAVLAVQTDVQAQGEKISYEAVDIYAVGGGFYKPGILPLN
ncbi:MAG: hypothetical protein ACXVA9_06105 [Bdellovibrionales bacterium]